MDAVKEGPGVERGDVMECEGFRDERMDVLYGEADAAAVRRVDEHHAVCAACREEMAALRRVRRDLSAWKLPDSLAPRRARLGRPAAWLATAAAVVAALGAGWLLSGSDLRRDKGALTLRWGSGAGELESVLARQETRHRAEMAALRAALSPPDAAAPPRAGSDEALLRRMEEMLRQSEARQDARVTARLAALSDKAETQRRYDLARVSAGLSYLDGKTGQDVVRTTELMGQVLQASQKK
jgi:hypothetical protein